MKVELFFTTNEIKEVLINNGYEILEIETWRSESCYHSKVQTVKYKREVAIKTTTMLDDWNDDTVRNTISIEHVFEQLIKTKLIKLLNS